MDALECLRSYSALIKGLQCYNCKPFYALVVSFIYDRIMACVLGFEDDKSNEWFTH